MRKVLYILGQLDDQDIEWMIHHGEKVTLAANHTIITAGNPISELYILLEGSCKVHSSDHEIAKLLPGEIIGEMSFVEAAPPNVSVTTLEDSSVFKITHQNIHTRMQDAPAFAARLYHAISVFLSDRLRKTVSQLGYGTDNKLEDSLEEDELDFAVLDKVHVAGDRFDRILKKLIGS